VSARHGVASPGAPSAIGPYSPAVRAGQLLFISGQIPIDPHTGAMMHGDVTAQTERVMMNIAALLAVEGATFMNVTKTTVYLTALEDFAEVNAAYTRFVSDPAPARSTVQVTRLPKDAKVEIDAIAVL
jgi:2-iminobutanoate/2-iminopropanoate deaminase